MHPGKTDRTGRMTRDDAIIDRLKQGKGLQSAAASQARIVITSVNNEYSLIFYEIRLLIEMMRSRLVIRDWPAVRSLSDRF